MDTIYQNSVCKVTCGNEKGTGFFVGNNIILTAFHIVIDCKFNPKTILIDFHGAEYEAVVKDFNNVELDIAILEIKQDSLNKKPLTLLKSPIFQGEKWETFGFSADESAQLAGELLNGTIKRQMSRTIHDVELECNNFQSQTDYKAFSGSPVFDMNGNVFAILLKRMSRILVAISIEKIYSFLEKNNLTVKTDYEKYDDKIFSRNWFAKHSKEIIEKAEPRYTSFANVELDYEKYFNAIGRTEKFYSTIAKLIDVVKQQVKKLNGKSYQLSDEVNQGLVALINQISNISEKNKEQIIDWKKIEELTGQAYEKVNECYHQLMILNENAN